MMDSLAATSIVSRTTGKGRVNLWHNDRQFTQLDPDEARSWALNILQAAEAADTDAWLTDWLTKKM